MENSVTATCQDARPYRLKNEIQHYAWGGRNDRAFIAHLIGVPVDGDIPYAELWMGAHPKAPSKVLDPQSGTHNLASWIKIDPESKLGIEQTQRHQGRLPYLFKVLSADQALSIQSHPNKAQAEQLHQDKPEHYPDDNHKPEIAIALDFLDALVGFISRDEYTSTLERTPELRELLPHSHQDLQEDVKSLLDLFKQNAQKIADCSEDIYERLKTIEAKSAAEELFVEQYQEYGPQDIGLLFILLLRRIYLGPGEAIYLPPGIPHAYLKGNIIECMANSDNVVRLGLTGKFCDAEALSNILDFSESSDFRVETSSDGYITEYLTPTQEFRVKALSLLQGESRAFTYHSGLTMFLMIEGDIALKWGGRDNLCTCMFRRGDVFIAPANLVDFSLHAKSHCKLYLVDIPV